MNSNRVRAIIINDNKLLFIKRTRNGETKYVLPGGKVEDGESLEDAVTREVNEETSLQVKLLEKVTTISDKDGINHHVYLFEYISGTPKLDALSPEIAIEFDQGITYEPEWIDVKDISSLHIWPDEIRLFLIEYLNIPAQ